MDLYVYDFLQLINSMSKESDELIIENQFKSIVKNYWDNLDKSAQDFLLNVQLDYFKRVGKQKEIYEKKLGISYE